ncbi:MAG: hypothetical protein U0903_17540 [Planctomycetales bacterium]
MPPPATRPQGLKRFLNGLWDYSIQPKADTTLAKPEGKILVPFPVESSLSGVMR